MKAIKFLVPLVIMLMVGYAVAGRKPAILAPYDVYSIGEFTGTVHSADSSFIIDTTNANGWATFDSDSLIGAIIVIEDTLGYNHFGYIQDFDTTGGTQCSIAIWPVMSYTPQKLDTYTIFWGFDANDKVSKYSTVRGDTMEAQVCVAGETLYSEPVPYKEGSDGESYYIAIHCKADTAVIDGNTATVDSVDYKVFLETSHNQHDWVVPLGHTYIVHVSENCGWQQKIYKLPDNTYYYRIGVTGNAGNHATDGYVWVTLKLGTGGK